MACPVQPLTLRGVVIAKLLKPGDRSFTAAAVRLIGVNGEQLGVVPLAKAHQLAQEEGLDLVVVAERSVPPVLRIQNFGKLQYEQKKSQKEQRKNNAAQKNKEVKFHINVDTNDYDIKMKKSLEFLEKRYKLKITLALRGREMAHQDMAYELMDRILADLAPYGEVESKPKLLGRSIIANFSPK